MTSTAAASACDNNRVGLNEYGRGIYERCSFGKVVHDGALFPTLFILVSFVKVERSHLVISLPSQKNKWTKKSPNGCPPS
ncbi:MAG: hypothetical protein Q4G59_01330 [Planctomycetia bacterium]|nr:hypothetical protein [Planctomycetia bacterium]